MATELGALTLNLVSTSLQASKPFTGYFIVSDSSGQLSAIDAQQVDKYHVGLGNVENLQNNLAAVASPTISDDASDGYSIGSRWIYDTHEYVCLDATTDAAVWVETTGAGGGGAGDFDGNAYTLQVRGLPAATWTATDPVLEARELAFETDTRLAKFGDGVTTWTSLPYAWGLEFTTSHKTAIEGATASATAGAIIARDVSGRAQVADPSVDEDIATKAYVDSEIASAVFDPNPDTITSVFSRTGDVVAEDGDYTAEQITDTDLKVIMTLEERNKLAAIDGSTGLPVQASSTEIDAGTVTEIRSFAPADIKRAARAHAVYSSSKSDVQIAAIAYRDMATHVADTTLPTVPTVFLLNSNLFSVRHVETMLPENSADPIDVSLFPRVNPEKTMVLHSAPRQRNGGPQGSYQFSSTKYGHVKLGILNDGRTLRFTPIDRGEATCPASPAAAQVIEYIGPSGGAYEFKNIGTYDVSITSYNTQATQNFTTALASDSERQKVWVLCDRGSGGQPSREFGPIAWPHSTTAFTVVLPRPPSQYATTIRCQAIHFTGSAWRLGKAYGLARAASGTGSASYAAVINGGTGYTDGATVTLSGATGTAATFTVSASGGVVTSLVVASGGNMSARPTNPASFTGGGGSGLTAFVHYNTGADSENVAIRDLYPTAFTDSTRKFTDAAGVSAQSVSAWSRALVLPGGWLGPGGAALATGVSTDMDPLVRPGTTTDGTDTSNVHFSFDAAANISGCNAMLVVLEDIVGGATGMRVTRYTESSPTDATDTDVDITTASIVDRDETIYLGRVSCSASMSAPSGASGTPPAGGTGGYQAAHMLLLPYQGADGTQYARARVGNLAAIADLDIQVAALPRSVAVS